DRERKLYFREMIARFSHHLALNWNMGEENTQTTEQRKDMAAYFAETDPYQHLRVIHTYPGQKGSVYNPLLGDDSDYTGASLQTSNPNQQQTFTDTRTWVNNSANAGKKWVIAIDEPGSAQIGVDEDPDDRKLTRHRVVWGNFMAGGAGSEFYYGYSTSCDDLDCQNHRTRDEKYTDAAIALQFFQVHFQSYLPEVINDNDLTPDDDQDYALAKAGIAYAVYRPNGGATAINLPTGINWLVQWYNPRTGTMSNSSSLTNGQLEAPDNNDWTALLLPGNCTAGTSCNDGDDCTVNDQLDENCNCSGTFVDTDADQTCDAEDVCPDFNDALLGTPCDDNDPCTLNDVYRSDCSCAGTTAGDQTLAISPVDDAYLQGSTRINDAELRIEEDTRVTYLKFDIPAFNGTLLSASLSLNVGSDPGSGAIIVARGASNDWTEDNLSISNAPTEMTQLGTLSETYTASQTYNWDLDVTTLGPGLLTLILRQTSGNDVAVKSTENTDTENGPSLQLIISKPVEPENCAVLPLNWEQFTATPVGKDALLQWTTTEEEDNRTFIVTHSTAPTNFVAIGEVAPQNDRGPNHYQFVHTPLTSGEHFYQIIQEDLDGSQSFSPIRSVSFSNDRLVTIYPNPFSTGVRLQFNSQLRELSVFNAYGARVFEIAEPREAPLDLLLEDLPAGVYWVRGTIEGQPWTERIVKR
ncbi:MAG: DNRLRE domain-containing protein, partial [Bacteroidota bacterium]